MNLSIEIKETLIFYEVPRVFVGADKLNTNYVCLLVEHLDMHDRFVATGISQGRLDSLLTGHLDLREAFSNPEVNEYYQFFVSDYSIRTIALDHLTDYEIPEEELPSPDIRFSDEDYSEEILTEAKQYARPILYLGIEPSANSGEAKVSANRLSRMLVDFQDVVKYAYKKSISTKPSSERRLLNQEENYTWDVYGSKVASFNLKMQSRMPGNLLGQSEIVNAMNLLDEVITSIEDFETSTEYLIKYKGHFVSKYLETLKLLSKTKETLFYSWVPSAYEDVRTSRITYRQAKSFVDHFSERTELGIEVVTLEGYFDEVYVSKGKWIFIDRDNKEYKGRVKKDTVTLEEITTSISYRIQCEEILTESVLPDSEKTELWLFDKQKL